VAAKDLYEKDYYQILGVTKGADSSTIKKQFKV
jgi:molecular chaperone DnaJ